MAPVVLGIELNGYTIYDVKMHGGIYGNPNHMTFIPGSESKIKGDNDKDYWIFSARFAENTIGTDFINGRITENVRSSFFDTIETTHVFSLKLHELYDPEWQDGDDEPPPKNSPLNRPRGDSPPPRDAYRWWEIEKNSKLRF
jgi:hypothetical protein